MADEPTLRDYISDAYDEEVAKASLDDSGDPGDENSTPPTPEPEETPPVEASLETLPPEEEPILPPSYWDDSLKDSFSKLPDRNLQKSFYELDQRRHQTLSQKETELSQLQTRYREFDEVVKPIEQQLALAGYSPAQALRKLLASDQYIRENPKRAILELINNNQINPNELFSEAPPSPELSALEQKFNLLLQHVQGQQHQAQLQSRASVEQEVAVFSEAKDQAGNLLHPHLNAVADQIVVALPIIQQQRPNLTMQQALSEAYTSAVYSNPTLRQNLFQQEQARLAQEQISQARNRVDSAEKKAVSLNGSPGSPASGKVDPTNLRALLSAAYDGTLQ